MQQTIRSLAFIGVFTLLAACDSAPKVAEADSKTADKAAIAAKPMTAADVVAQTGNDGKGGSADQPTAVAVKPADADRPTAISTKTAGGDQPAAVAGKAGDRVKAADAGTKPADDTKPAEPASDGGDSLAAKAGWADYTRDIQAKISAVNTSCGTKLSASYDKSTYTDFDPMKDRTQAACKAAVGTLQAICASEEGKASVQQLSKTVCKFSTTGTGIEKSGTTLVVKIDPVKSSITGKAAGSYSWASAIKEVL